MSRLQLIKTTDAPVMPAKVRDAKVTLQTLTGLEHMQIDTIIEDLLSTDGEARFDIDLRRYETQSFSLAFQYLREIGIKLLDS